jgi:hypothetical protein
MIGICREHAKNVKRWRDGQMAIRWCAAGMLEASKQFRRVNGHIHLPALRAALERHVAEQAVSATRHRAATEVPRNSGHPLERHSTHATSCRTTCEVPFSLGHLNSRKCKFPLRGRHFRACRPSVRSRPVNDPG